MGLRDLLTFRASKGSPLTNTEVDNNFGTLADTLDTTVIYRGAIPSAANVNNLGVGIWRVATDALAAALTNLPEPNAGIVETRQYGTTVGNLIQTYQNSFNHNTWVRTFVTPTWTDWWRPARQEATDLNYTAVGGPVLTANMSVQNAIGYLDALDVHTFTTLTIPTVYSGSTINVYGLGLLHWNAVTSAYEKLFPCKYNYFVDSMMESNYIYQTYALTANNNFYNLMYMYQNFTGPSGAGTWSGSTPAAASVNSYVSELGYSSFVPVRSGQRLKFTTAHGGTVGTTGAYTSQRIEHLAQFASRTIIFSFYMAACSGTPPTITKAKVQCNYGTGGSPSAAVDESVTISYTPTLNQLTRCTVKVTIGALSGTYGTNNNSFLEVGIWWPNVLFDVYTTMWQLEDVTFQETASGMPALASRYVVEEPQASLLRISRYFEISDCAAGAAYPTPPGAIAMASVTWRIGKRNTPSCTLSAISTVNAVAVVGYADVWGAMFQVTQQGAPGNYWSYGSILADARL